MRVYLFTSHLWMLPEMHTATLTISAPLPTHRPQVRRIVFDASYLVLGLGDVYLGAPCAVPVNPLHRLVTTKMNPARTFTHEVSNRQPQAVLYTL